MARLDFIRKGSIDWMLDNSIKSNSANFVNARFGLQNDIFDVTLFVQNVNERVATEAFASDAGIARMPNQPRFYGIEASYNF